MATFEIRNGQFIDRLPTDEIGALNKYASYEVIAVQEDGTKHLVCAFYGGASLMLADMAIEYFKKRNTPHA